MGPEGERGEKAMLHLKSESFAVVVVIGGGGGGGGGDDDVIDDDDVCVMMMLRYSISLIWREE